MNVNENNTILRIKDLLSSQGDLEISEISKKLKIDNESVAIALKNMAEQNVIFFFKEKNGKLKVCLT